MAKAHWIAGTTETTQLDRPEIPKVMWLMIQCYVVGREAPDVSKNRRAFI